MKFAVKALDLLGFITSFSNETLAVYVELLKVIGKVLIYDAMSFLIIVGLSSVRLNERVFSDKGHRILLNLPSSNLLQYPIDIIGEISD